MMRHYVFYKDRPEWADVKPVPQYESPANVVRIAYSPEFVDANDYLRAVLLKDERSARTLELTTTVLQLNPANYTVWEYRRRILTALGTDLKEELLFSENLINETSKNYQLWHHRQWIVTQLAEQTEKVNSSDDNDAHANLGLNELSFIASVLENDSKHYHAWQYRRWVVTYFKIPAATELLYTSLLIDDDVYNNSAWNHRFVIVTKDEGLSHEVLQREVEFVQRHIHLAPSNESSWNYLYGLLVPPPSVVASSYTGSHSSPKSDLADPNKQPVDQTGVVVDDPQSRVAELVTHPPPAANLRRMRRFAEDLANSDPRASNSVALLGFLVDVYADCISARTQHTTNQSVEHEQPCNTDSLLDSCPTGDPAVDAEESLSELVERARSLCERLALELDRIRETYWRYRSRQMQALANEKQ